MVLTDNALRGSVLSGRESFVLVTCFFGEVKFEICSPAQAKEKPH
jgi:hypothetical protein